MKNNTNNFITNLKPRLPMLAMVTVLFISFFITAQGLFNYLFLMIGQFLSVIPIFALFGDPTNPSLLMFLLYLVFLVSGWLFSTKFKKFQTIKWRKVWFWNMVVGITSHYLLLISAPVYNHVLPFIVERATELEVSSIWMEIAVGDMSALLHLLIFTPTVITFLVIFWIVGQYQEYSKEIREAFMEFEMKNPLLQKLLKIENKEHWPDVVLGPESESRELLVQPGRDRTLNNIIVGSIGTGKTSALVLPILNQDLHWMTKFINDYPKIYKREDYHTEKVKGMYLNGISIIEPSNDLCQKAYQLVKAHGIPEESVFYIDPTNPNTPSINPMQGPVEKVAEAFAMVMEGLQEGSKSNFFFAQSERNHLKHYIYLLKLHEPNQEVTFDMLLKMYDNPQLVRQMHVKLKATIPENIDKIEDRDERNHWAIVKQIDDWFDMNLLPRMERSGGQSVPKKVTHGEYRGEIEYYDAKAEYVQGLRNVLNDIGANPLIRRVLFGKSNFDFDTHLESGGVLLVNTAKGELQGLSNVLGKLVLLSLQNAVFRRKPNVSTFHHILVDEFPDYIYLPFKEFPAQSRKYKTIITVVAQTVAQLADKYGEKYMQTLLGTLRHKMVYGDIPYYDAQLFSNIFGEEERFEESINEQNVNVLQEEPMLRKGNTYQKKKEAILSPSDIIYQKPFQCAVKIVANNKPIPVKQIDANFVPEEEFEEAIVIVEDEASKVWLKNRNKKYLSSENDLVKEGIEDNEDNITEEMKDEFYNIEKEKIELGTFYDEGDDIEIEEEIDDHNETIEIPQHSIETKSFEEKVEKEPYIETIVDDSIEDFSFNQFINPNQNMGDEEESDAKPEVSVLEKEQEELITELMNELEQEDSSEGEDVDEKSKEKQEQKATVPSFFTDIDDD